MANQYVNFPGEIRVKGNPLNAPANSVLSGTYDIGVFVNGDAFIGGNTVVQGDLIVSGRLLNQGGYSLEVNGNLIIGKNFNFTPSSTAIPQGDLIVHGDFISFDIPSTEFSEFRVNPGQNPNIAVYGDFCCVDQVDLSGQIGAPGVNLTVKGSIIGYPTIKMDGGDADATHAPGVGGTFNCNQNVVASISCKGGNSDQASFDAAQGGTINIYGFAGAQLIVDGGNGSNGANGGNAGTIYVGADCLAAYFDPGLSAKGGTCVGGGGSPTVGAGNGGSIEVDGDVVGSVYAWGGNISGSFGNASSSTVSGGNGGTVTVWGNLNMTTTEANNNVEVNGGNDAGCSSSNAVIIQCGPGGTVTINGDVWIGNEINTNGGNVFTSPTLKVNGGNGGTISVFGKIMPGNGYNFNFSGITSNGGDGGGASGFNGGNGGAITLKHGMVGFVTCNGGVSDTGVTAGHAGTITIGPSFHIGGTLQMLDGSVGVAPTTGGGLIFEGQVSISTLNVSNRASLHIGGDNVFGSTIVQLAIGSMPGKKTLWDGSAETADISGILTNSVFKFAGSKWYCIPAGDMNYRLIPSEYDNGNSGSALTIDLSKASAQKITMTASCTFTLSNPVVGGTYLLKIVQDGTGGWTITWPGTVIWPNNTAPSFTTTANQADLVTLYWDGSKYWGNAALAYQP